VRVALVDDSALFRRGLAMLLATVGVEVTAQASTSDEILQSVASCPPDVVVLDVRLPPSFTDEGLLVAELLQARHPGIGVLILSTYAVSGYATRLLQNGSRGTGYLLKDRVDDIDALRDALARVAAGQSVIDPELVSRLLAGHRRATELDRLSQREKEVLKLIAEGRSNAAVSQRLHLSAKTVEGHVAGLFAKLGLPAAADDNRRVLAALKWLRAGGAGFQG
jgi:DNA-binding NarL/FixJ family response regulator